MAPSGHLAPLLGSVAVATAENLLAHMLEEIIVDGPAIILLWPHYDKIIDLLHNKGIE